MNLEQLVSLAQKSEINKDAIEEGENKRRSFLERWPKEQILKLSVEEYADTSTKDSFIYWLERKMGGIGGGNASKFGIYLNNEGRYAEGAGNSRKTIEGDELQGKLKHILEKIDRAIRIVEAGDIEKLNDFESPVWAMVLNKILYLYYPEKFIDIGADRVINAIASDLGIEEQPSSIVTNHHISQKLSNIEPFRTWPRGKYAEFLWEVYNPRVFRNYYLIGSKYGGHEDVFPQMQQESMICTGFAAKHDLQHLLGVPQREIKQFLDSIGEDNNAYRSLRYFLNLKPGDWVAIKSSGAPRSGQAYLSIVGIAEVVDEENFYQHDPDGLGHKIKVKFIETPVFREFEFGGYGATMHKLTNNIHINSIFYSDDQQDQDQRSLIINRIIRKYKELVNIDNNRDELYKWRLIKEFQSTWDIDSADLDVRMKRVKFENLLYQNSIYLFKNANLYREEARELLEDLFNEELDLKRRIDTFQARAREIFKKYMPNKKHSQDERAIAVYLTYRYPAKYTFYKSSYYEKYLKFLDEKPRDPGEKYLHYLELVKELKENYILKDQELLSLSDRTLDDTCYEDPERNILAQDILYRVFDQSDFQKEIAEPDGFPPRDERDTEEIPMNLILYGPPGTGKTYRLRNYYFKKFTTRATTKTKEEFLREVAEGLSWWQTIGIVVLDLGNCKVPDIYSHPLLQSKLYFTNTKTPKNTIWSILQSHTKNDCPHVAHERRMQPQFFWKSEQGYWSIDKDIVANETPELKELLEQIRSYNPKATDRKRYLFTTFHQSYSYEDFIEGIKPVLDESESGDISYRIVSGVFKKIVQQALEDPEHPYALFIDEINRGNVANVFGELITLLEEDKRMGEKNELAAVLPYSKETFSIPGNLHIIGTMNTADRSVEALDTALRRRFSFLELKPMPELIRNHPDLETDLQLLLTTINQRIERLIDKDHAIGHSYFMGIADSVDPMKELKLVFATRILPLLNEYFYGDPVKIGSVLGEHFISRKDSRNIIWPQGFVPEDMETKEVYEIKDPMSFEDETPFVAIYES